jgi:hypothetical protein
MGCFEKVVNIRAPRNAGSLLTSAPTISISKLIRGVSYQTPSLSTSSKSKFISRYVISCGSEQTSSPIVTLMKKCKNKPQDRDPALLTLHWPVKQNKTSPACSSLDHGSWIYSAAHSMSILFRVIPPT